MANITKIKEQARELCLMTIADPNFDMQHADEKSLEYLEHILGLELENRRQNAIARFRKVCNLPHIRFDIGRVKSDVRSQLEQIARMQMGRRVPKPSYNGSLRSRQNSSSHASSQCSLRKRASSFLH